MREARHKNAIICDSSSMRYLKESNSWRQKVGCWLPRAEGIEKRGVFVSWVKEFQLGKIQKMKTFMYLLHNNVNELNATVAYI